MMHTKKTLSILLTICMIAGLLPAAAIPAHADGPDEPVGISLGMSAVKKNDTVWFGKNGDDPIAWRVLSPKNDHELSVSGDDNVLVISKYLQGNTAFDGSGDESGSSNEWDKSGAQAWCEEFYADNGNAYEHRWSRAEKDAIAATSVVESEDYTSQVIDEGGEEEHGGDTYGPAPLNGEYVFFLSAEEADTYFDDDDDRMGYFSADDEASGNASDWWLRSSFVEDADDDDDDWDETAGCVDYEGWLGGDDVASDYGARPAFNFDLSQVLFSSAAVNGKPASDTGAFYAPTANATTEWKLTLLDTRTLRGEHRNFAVTEKTAKAAPGGTITLRYSGATTGDNEYVSALLCNSTGTTVLYYGSGAWLDPDGGSLSGAALDAAYKASGAVSFTLPSGIGLGTYTLKVFNERKNGDYLSDYASAFQEVTLTVKNTPAPLAISFDESALEKDDAVWFGKNREEPAEWRVLSEEDDDRLPVSGSGSVLLISKYLQGRIPFGSSNAWASSTAKAWCDGYYSGTNGGAWSDAEKAAIKATSVTETADYTGGYDNSMDYGPASLSGERFFFLSAEEADTYFWDDDDRKAYASAANERYGTASKWWLRSPQSGGTWVGCVSEDGWTFFGLADGGNYARPAFNLDSSAVLFFSAVGCKEGTAGTLSEIGAYSGSGWKLTLPDATGHGIAVTETTATAVPGGTVTLRYSGATTGDNEYVSALLCNNAGTTVLAYGSSAALDAPEKASGTVSFTLPGNLVPGASYKLKVFNEQKNGDFLSDYAGAFDEVTLTVAAGYLVGVTKGTGMTRNGASGAASQGVTIGAAITPVVYEADEGYFFPENYAVTPVNGVCVTRNGWTQITVFGTPTANASVTLAAATAKTKESTPGATFTATGRDSGELSGLTANAKYVVSGAGLPAAEITADAHGVHVIASLLTEGTLSIVKKGDGTTTLDSDAQTIYVGRMETPELVATQLTAIGGKGSIPTTAAYQKSTDGTNWTDCDGAWENLDPGTYYVRARASGTKLTSEPQSVTINDYAPNREAQPAAVFTATGYGTGTLSGLVDGGHYVVSHAANAEFTLSGSTSYALTEVGNGTLSIVKKGNGTTADSYAQTITITRADKPTGLGKTDCTGENVRDGSITGLDGTLAYEYRKGEQVTYMAVAAGSVTINGLGSGTYYVRVAASGTTLASEDADALTIAALAPTPGGGGIPFIPGTATPTTTTTNPDGSITRTTTNADGSKTIVTTTKDGSTSTVKLDKYGNILSIEAAPSAKAIFDAAAKGEPVTLPVKVRAARSTVYATPVTIALPANSGRVTVEIPTENLTAGTVAVLVKPDGTEELVKTSTVGANGVILTLSGSATVKIVDNTKSFGDVRGDEWYAKYVAWAASHEVMNGVGNGIFDANATTTGAMVAQILMNLAGGSASPDAAAAAFDDVAKTDWFASAISWITETGIARGEGDRFGAAEAISRERAVVMMYRFAQYMGYDVSARADLSAFSDAGSVSDWAKEAMSWAVAAGIVSGATDANGSVILDAQGSATRAQFAAIIERFCENAAK